MAERRHWVVVVSRDHARRGVTGGFIMANHGKRGPLARMARGDGIIVYSPTTSYPDGEPLRAVSFVGEVTGDDPSRARSSRAGSGARQTCARSSRWPWQDIHDHLPTSRIRFGFFEIDAADAEAIRALAVPLGS